VVADDIIHRNAYGKGDSSINDLSIDLFGVQLSTSLCDHGVSKLTKFNNLLSWKTLGDEALKCEVDNLGRFLVLGSDIAATW
jgi:hypothetical protein